MKKLSYNDYDFTYDFQVTQELLDHDYIVLNCEGIDTIGTIVVNNQIIGNVKNMHRTYRFDLINFLIVGKNTVTIKIDSPVLYAERKQKEFFLWELSDEMVMNGHSHIRKAHSMFGWDWGLQLSDMGIWRPIYIEAYDASRIKEVYMDRLQ